MHFPFFLTLFKNSCTSSCMAISGSRNVFFSFLRIRLYELLGLSLLLFSLALFTALLTHSPTDPSWNHAANSETLNFLGTFGALIKNGKERTYKQGYKWKSEFKGQSFVTEVTGSEHGDFRLFRTDITPYETLDPLGNKVNYRPQLRSDQKSISGYHSVEIDFFATILKSFRIKSTIVLCSAISFSSFNSFSFAFPIDASIVPFIGKE